VRANPAEEANIGDIITYTCSLRNSGDLSFQDISAESNISGSATYQGGDANENSLLDSGETWIFTATYTVQAGDYPDLVAEVTVSATTATGVAVVDTETLTTRILPVSITGPAEGDTVNFRTIEVSGTIFDATFIGGSITANGVTGAIVITEGDFITFTGNATLIDGQNTITVTISNEQGQTASDTVTVYLEPYAIRVELTWDAGDGTDMDAHLIRPGRKFNDPVGDCYYGNQRPEWGDPEDAADNPYFYVDDFAGWGPEIITLLEPYDGGDYQVTVHYYNDNGTGPSEATVRIYIYEVLAAEYKKQMGNNEIWDCAKITWPSGVISVPPPPTPLS
jgi:uncharacterized repeat protein (TIGR01451 family)